MKITFLGAVNTVTGSRFLVESDSTKILVDCGMFQGHKDLRLLNWKPFPVEVNKLDAVILTHAHIDHTGYFPVLYNQGYRGPVLCTHPTKDFCEILLPDAGFLQEEEAWFANKHKYSRHQPALPLFTEADARLSLELFRGHDFETPIVLEKNFTITFKPVGHILGAGSVLISNGKTNVVFSGDVGRQNDFLMNPPQPILETDFLVVESTYGDKKHDSYNPKEQLAWVVNQTIKRRGVVVIPAFAVGRTQDILYLLTTLRREKKIPSIPIYLNSPMAHSATDIFCRYPHEHKLSPAQCQLMYEGVIFIRDVEGSKALNEKKDPMIIVSASGMASGGRVLHHIKSFAPNPKNTIIFVGFQVPGTRGHAIINGSDSIKIHGEYVPIKSQIVFIENLSAHADYEELLVWLKHTKKAPKKTFIVHGEPNAQSGLKNFLQEKLNWPSIIPKYKESFEL